MKILFRLFICVNILVLFQLIIHAQLPFDTALISAVLKDGAHSVIRENITAVDILAPDKAVYRTKQAVTILDDKASGELSFYAETNKYYQLEQVDIRVFDAKGNQLKKYTKKDLMSQATNDAFVEDGKAYFLRIIPPVSYPLTVETDCEMRLKGILNIPSYNLNGPNQSVQHSSYTLNYPESMQVEWKAYGMDIVPVKSEKDGTKTLIMEVKNWHAQAYEESSGPASKQFPYVLFHTNKFKYDEYPGDMSSWKEFGLWLYKLNESTNDLSEANKAEVQKLVSGISNKEDKVRVLYSYLQQNFRYVSIQLGIGGLKSFPADFVHEKKWGDCKGLSNYLKACLKAVNIQSYVACINAGYDQPPVDPGFSYSSFNHVILCVPMEKDTIWLECTSRVNDFGHLGDFTENRNALLYTEAGGVLVRTPASKAEENVFRMQTTVSLNEDGSGSIEGILFTTGNYKYDMVNLAMEKNDVQKEFLVKQVGFVNPDEYTLNFSEKTQAPYKLTVDMNLEKIPDFMAGSKMFIKPRMYQIWSESMPPANKRMYDFIFQSPVVKTDTTKYILPKGFVVESLPPSQEISCTYGTYRCKYWFEESTGTIYSFATVTLTRNRIPPEKYQETREFIEKLKVAEGKKLIIKKI
jgi:hypothetical protein